jgi:hypothetical protein
MTRSVKKARELNILRLVYKAGDFPVIKPTERPDFIVHDETERFGVEVTEYYVDQASARLQNRPGYANDVIDGNYIHKDDKPHLRVVKIKVLKQSGRRRKPPTQFGVMQNNIPITDRIALLIKIIAAKSELLNSYRQDLNAIDLLIYEERGAFFDGVDDFFTGNTFLKIYQGGLLRDSGFRHILLLIATDAGKNHRLIQLK